MLQSFIPVLLLAAVALSSSNILPKMSTNHLESEPIFTGGQQNDNIFSNKFNARNILSNVFYTPPNGVHRLLGEIAKSDERNTHTDTEDSIDDIVNAADKFYDGEGFRKEQWHNYPRQLDRLHKFLFPSHKSDVKRTPETYDFMNPEDEDNDSTATSYKLEDISTNEYFLQSDGQNIYDEVIAATNPLLILKIHLACLNDGLSPNAKEDSFQNDPKIVHKNQIEEERFISNEINPETTVKREGANSSDDENSDNTVPATTKSKRLFSLWSRLQNLSHKGHELPHRRHLAFYGIPDENGDSGGTLNSPQTRATFVRPPGSPLRWG